MCGSTSRMHVTVWYVWSGVVFSVWKTACPPFISLPPSLPPSQELFLAQSLFAAFRAHLAARDPEGIPALSPGRHSTGQSSPGKPICVFGGPRGRGIPALPHPFPGKPFHESLGRGGNPRDKAPALGASAVARASPVSPLQQPSPLSPLPPPPTVLLWPLP